MASSGDKHPSRRGCLLSIEGGEGAGKSHLLPHLATALRAQGYRVIETREPGGTPIGMQLRALLLDATHPLPPTAELFLMEAARAIHVTEIIEPALAQGAIVLTDRYIDSTTVYQGIVRQLDQDLITRLNAVATNGLSPDLTLYLDVDPEIGLTRRRRHADTLNHFDRADLLVHQRIRQGFQALARLYPTRFCTIDAEESPEWVRQAAVTAIARYLTTHPYPLILPRAS